MEYLTLKAMHVGCAALSITGFAARGVLMLRDSPLLGARWLRIAPHVVDTALLGSALGLAWMSGQYPFAQSWLTAKIAALIVYIALGSIALRYGSSKAIRATAYVLALAAAGYLVAVALTRDPFAALR